MNSLRALVKPAGILPSSKSQHSTAPVQPTPGVLESEAPSLGAPPAASLGVPPAPAAEALPPPPAVPAAELPEAPLPLLPATAWFASLPPGPSSGSGALEHAPITTPTAVNQDARVAAISLPVSGKRGFRHKISQPPEPGRSPRNLLAPSTRPACASFTLRSDGRAARSRSAK